MESFNVLRGREPVKTNGSSSYCAGYIKYLPDRAKLYGIEFSGFDKTSHAYKNPDSGFNYYIFCSEAAWVNYAKEKGITLEPKFTKAVQNKDSVILPDSNPALFVVSSGTYDPTGEATGENLVNSTVSYPHTIGFQAVSYTHEPRPYSNIDAFVSSDAVQYPLYLFVEFDDDPGITELDYQLISGK